MQNVSKRQRRGDKSINENQENQIDYKKLYNELKIKNEFMMEMVFETTNSDTSSEDVNGGSEMKLEEENLRFREVSKLQKEKVISCVIRSFIYFNIQQEEIKEFSLHEKEVYEQSILELQGTIESLKSEKLGLEQDINELQKIRSQYHTEVKLREGKEKDIELLLRAKLV